MNWRGKATPIVREVLARTAGQPEHAIKQALFDAYPFGERDYYPYKVWLDEIRRQRGKKRKKGPCRCGHGHGSHRGACKAADCSCGAYSEGNPDQVDMFSREARP
jgi:hypothetical protein